MNELLKQLENMPIGNALAFGGHTGLSKFGRIIGEEFLKEHAQSAPSDIIESYKIINDFIWDISETVGDGFGRVVGKFVADAFIKDAK